MAKKAFESLSETMFYVLMAFGTGELCGTEIVDWIDKKTRGRIQMGPGTLYAILSKFEGEKLIVETAVMGRRRSYHITSKGRAIYQEELSRLRQCVLDAETPGEES